jgi:hypothetical protein
MTSPVSFRPRSLIVPEPKKRPSRPTPVRRRAAQQVPAGRLHPLPAHPPRRPTGRRLPDPDLAAGPRSVRAPGDHARLGHRPIVLATFRETVAQHGPDRRTLAMRHTAIVACRRDGGRWHAAAVSLCALSQDPCAWTPALAAAGLVASVFMVTTALGRRLNLKTRNL